MCFLVSLGQSILRASYSGGVQHVRKDSTVTEKINLEQTSHVTFREDLFNRINWVSFTDHRKVNLTDGFPRFPKRWRHLNNMPWKKMQSNDRISSHATEIFHARNQQDYFECSAEKNFLHRHKAYFIAQFSSVLLLRFSDRHGIYLLFVHLDGFSSLATSIGWQQRTPSEATPPHLNLFPFIKRLKTVAKRSLDKPLNPASQYRKID